MAPVSPQTDVRTLLDALDHPALVTRNGTVLVANEAARRVLGARLEGSDVRLAIRHPQALEHILPGRSTRVDVTGIGGFERPWTIAISELESGSVLVRMIDRSAAIAAERMRVDFVANASHELRTPLSTILGYAETIADEPEPELAARFAGVIREEARRMLRIIEDLMSLSRIEADRFAAPEAAVDLGEIISVAVRNARMVADPRGCTVDVETDPDLPTVLGDSPQLLQLLDNLLTNALRYGCPRVGGTVVLTAGTVKGSAQISIADRGPGIAAGHLPRLTERFYRVDEGRSRDSGGTGLGLAIVKHIIERHRGTLDIRSILGEGTTVTVRLPIAGTLSQ